MSIMKHSFKDWVAVTRYWSFPVSVSPVLATFAFLFGTHRLPSGPFPYLVFVMAILGVVILHSAGNVLSDWFDYRKGVDNEEAFAVPNLVFHKFEPSEYLVFSAILFAVGIALGVAIVALTNIHVLYVGIAAVALTALYSFLKFHALGDLDIFIIFGILPVIGTCYAVTGSFCPEALVLCIPVGIITVSVLHSNNTLDIISDAKAGIKTFAMILGGRTSTVLYRVYMAVPFVCIIASVLSGLLAWPTLLSLAAIVPAMRNFKAASRYEDLGIETMKGLDQATAQLQLMFSVLLSVGLFLSVLV